MAYATNIVTNWYTVLGTEGALLNQTQPINVTTSPDVPGPWLALGQVAFGNNNSEWVVVQASTTVSANSLVAIDANFAANPLSSVLAASTMYSYGIAEFQTSVANPTDYFWAMRKAAGGALVNVVTTAARGVQLYLSSTQPGAVTSSVSAQAIKGLYVNTSLVGSTAAVDTYQTTYITIST